MAPRIMSTSQTLADVQPQAAAVAPRVGHCVACGAPTYPPHPDRRNVPPRRCGSCQRQSRAKPDLPCPVGPRITLGDRLRWARYRSGLTQVLLAELAGRFVSQIVRWERHKTVSMQSDCLLALSEALGVAPSVLLGPKAQALERAREAPP